MEQVKTRARATAFLRAFSSAAASSFETPACGGLLRMRSSRRRARCAAPPAITAEPLRRDEVLNPHGEERGNAARLRTMLRIAGRTIRPRMLEYDSTQAKCEPGF